ncbi:hypothetical protein D3C85_1926660 [compost metagenome]
MKQVLQAGAVEVGQHIGGHDLDLGQQVGGIRGGVGDASLDLAAGDANLVD